MLFRSHHACTRRAAWLKVRGPVEDKGATAFFQAIKEAHAKAEVLKAEDEARHLAETEAVQSRSVSKASGSGAAAGGRTPSPATAGAAADKHVHLPTIPA